MMLRSKIIAGTALGLLMGSVPAFAVSLAPFSAPAPADGRVILVQGTPEAPQSEADCETAEDRQACLDRLQPAAEQPAVEEPATEQPAAEEPAAEEPAAEEPAAEEPAASTTEEPAATTTEEPAATATEEPAATTTEEPAAATTEEPAATTTEEPAATTTEEPAATTTEEPAATTTEEPAATTTEEPAATTTEEPAATTTEQPAATTTEQPAATTTEEPAATTTEEPAATTTEQPAATTTEQPAATTTEQPAATTTEQPAATTTEQPAATTQQPGDAPTLNEAAEQAGEVLPENAAPVLDSNKPRRRNADGAAQAPAETPPAAQAPSADAPPPPATDQEAQAGAPAPADIPSATAEEGQRVDGDRPRRRDRPEGAERREVGDRFVIEFNNQIFVESDEPPLYVRQAREVYYEELPRGRVREVVIRENGVQIITVRDRYGEVIRRTKIMPDGREILLVYVDIERRNRPDDAYYYDPGEELPPLVLNIPVQEYILDAGRVEDPDVYYTFLDQPPIEQIRRTYTIEEVKHSARIRDTVRRVDLDTITFEFGSAEVPESQIPRLEGIAQAIERMLEENPAETFLIEGHTDAVGSEIANLALSDRRAEAVAAALVNVFGIPPENLTTQGYGEQYLKIATEEPERENRRVSMRRITPLVTPVASAQ